jgi:rhodanese-related sulfurtransferase
VIAQNRLIQKVSLAMQTLSKLILSALLFAASPLVSLVSAAEPLPSTINSTEMLSRLNQNWVQIIDVRPATEFRGDVVRTLRTGFVPGAVNAPQGQFQQLSNLQRNRETIVYGFDEASSQEAANALRAAGFHQVRVLEGAWQAWGNRIELPAAQAKFADVEALYARLSVLEQQLANKITQK